MRLDKFVGKAAFNLKIKVYDWETGELLFTLLDGDDYSGLKEDMKKYKVRYFNILDDFALTVDVKKKED